MSEEKLFDDIIEYVTYVFISCAILLFILIILLSSYGAFDPAIPMAIFVLIIGPASCYLVKSIVNFLLERFGNPW